MAEPRAPWRRLDAALLGAALALTFAVHAPALDSAFAGDDQILLYDAANMPLGEYLLDMHGGHLMPVHKLVIVAMHRVFGYRAAPFFALALATHLLNVALLYVGLRHVASALPAAFGSALWGAAVIHQSSLAWFSVYGQILVVTCLLLVWLSWLRVDAARGAPGARTLVVWNLLLIAAGAAFGAGIALAVAAPLLAWAFVDPPARRRAGLGLLPAACLVPALYVVAFLVSRPVSSPLAASFEPGLAARLLLALPAAGVAALGFGAAATQDAGRILAGPLAGTRIEAVFPLLRNAALALVLPLLAALGFAAGPLRRRALGAALIALAVYALVALGRAEFVPLMSAARVASEPRFHYAALIGAAMGIACSLAAVRGVLARPGGLGGGRAGAVLGASVLACWLALLGASALPVSRTIQAKNFAPAAIALRDDLAALEAVIASAPPGEVYVINRQYDGTRWLFDMRGRPDRFPGLAALFVVTHEEDELDGRRVRFVEDRKQVLETIRARPQRRIARLLVSRAEAKAAGVRFYHVPLRRGYVPPKPAYRR